MKRKKSHSYQFVLLPAIMAVPIHLLECIHVCLQIVFMHSCCQAMYDMLMEYKSEGIPIDGLGIQGHTKNFTAPDPTLMKVSHRDLVM